MDLTWIDLALAYSGYLTAIAWGVPRFGRARVPAVSMAAAVSALWQWPAWAAWSGAWAVVGQIVIPGLALLAAYRASGAFFVAPNAPLERWLLGVDQAALRRTRVLDAYRAAPVPLREAFELLYLLVYVMVPLGAAVLIIGNRPDALDGFWTAVFAAELPCYAMLPWLQTRSPRALEDPGRTGMPQGPVRRLNLAVLARGSIHANTIPSGHAAGAAAIALAVGSALPPLRAAFLALALGITLATVLGRYHYLVDSVLGVAVALVAWATLGR